MPDETARDAAVSNAMIEHQREPTTERGTTSEPTTQGRVAIRPTPRIAASGGLMIAVPPSTPKAPKLETVKVLPRRSVASMDPSRAEVASRWRSSATSGNDLLCASRITTTTRPRSVCTATPRCTGSNVMTSLARVSKWAFSRGKVRSAMTHSRRITAKGVTRPSVAAAERRWRRSRSRVASALTHAVAAGASWCERVSRSAAMRATPASAERTPPATTGVDWLSSSRARSRSAWVTMPPGPLPAIVLKSISNSAASRRTSGEAGGPAAVAGRAGPFARGDTAVRRDRGAGSLVP